MSNRADRRRERKALPRYKRMMTPEQRKAALVKNGITPKDLEDEYKRGLKDGTSFANYAMCAAIGLAMNDLYGFGRGRVTRTLNLAAKYMMESFTTRELMEAVYKRIGFEFVDDPVSGNLVEEID